jgi:acyl-coenzyme A thioesterase PaaI-like protein
MFNFFPAYRGGGGRVVYISDDFRELRVKVPLNWRTRNKVGTIFGGSIYSAVDPIYMIMLMRILGEEYVVWDRSAKIRFKRPGRETLFASFVVTEQESDEIIAVLETRKSTSRTYFVELCDSSGRVHATVEKEIFVTRKREPVPVKTNEFVPATE